MVLSVWQRVCRCEKVVGNGWVHWRRSVLNSRALIKRASQLGTRQASHKETHGREEGETRFVCLCVWDREIEREREALFVQRLCNNDLSLQRLCLFTLNNATTSQRRTTVLFWISKPLFCNQEAWPAASESCVTFLWRTALCEHLKNAAATIAYHPSYLPENLIFCLEGRHNL